MHEVFVCFKTDAHHSYSSRDIIGIATSEESAVEICKAHAKKEGIEISDQDLWNLINLKQTQGYEGEGEFQFESMLTDTQL